MNRISLNNPVVFLILALILFFPAFLINLQDQPIIEDEAIRAIVAFEMDKSGDFITPTIGGEQYMRKPPVYNWLIVLSYRLFGNFSETAIRFPMILSVLLFSLTIFLFVRKELGTKPAVLNALIFMTTGRILFFESLHGLIDITFSWLIYLFFMLSWIFLKRQKYLYLFLSAYMVAAITFLMKGLPVVAFIGISFLVLFISQKKFKLLFNWRHIAGILVFLVFVGAYYFIYCTQNSFSFDTILDTLIGQSTRRTAIRFGWFHTIKHLFTFPLEMLYHFMPWSLLTLVLFIGGNLRKNYDHPFLKYQLLLIAFNIIPYWTSPEVFPRYILMLVPMYFTILTYLYYESAKYNKIMTRIIDYIFGGLLVLSVFVSYGSLFADATKNFDNILLISIILSIILLAIVIYYWKNQATRLLTLGIALLVIRIGFDLIVLPTRQFNTIETLSIEQARDLAEVTKDQELYTYWDQDIEPVFYYKRSILFTRFRFHLSVARDNIVYISSEKVPGRLYVCMEHHLEGEKINRLGTANQMLDGKEELILFEFRE